MQVLEATVAANPWPLRRERAAELAERYPHAAEMLRLYQALIDHLPARGGGQGGGGDIASLAVEHVFPGVIDATVEFGPRALRDGVVAQQHARPLDVARRDLLNRRMAAQERLDEVIDADSVESSKAELLGSLSRRSGGVTLQKVRQFPAPSADDASARLGSMRESAVINGSPISGICTCASAVTTPPSV